MIPVELHGCRFMTVRGRGGNGGGGGGGGGGELPLLPLAYPPPSPQYQHHHQVVAAPGNVPLSMQIPMIPPPGMPQPMVMPAYQQSYGVPQGQQGGYEHHHQQQGGGGGGQYQV